MNTKLFSLLCFCFLVNSCNVSFRGTSIPADVNTFYVDQTILSALNAPGDLPETFMEALRQKIRDQSNLNYNSVNPDIEFKSDISVFAQGNEAESAENNRAALLKLTITVKVEYISNKNEADNWTNSFSHTVNFDPSVDFQTAQAGFIDEIFEQITEKIFNKSFTNW